MSEDWVVIRPTEEDDNQSNSSSNSSNHSDENDEILPPPPSSSSGDTPAMVVTRPSSRSRRHDNLSPLPAVVTRHAMSPPLVRSTTPLTIHTGITTPPPLSRSNNNTPVRATTPNSSLSMYDALANRPRSNPRVRTPMRYESPLNSNAFLRDGSNGRSFQDQQDNVREDERREGQRISIRPGAGLAVGSNLSSTAFRSNNISTTTTTNQYQHVIQPPYHAHRKVRRWNNDKMMGIASELAKYSKRSKDASINFTRGEAEAFQYRVANYPLEYRSEFTRLVTNDDSDNPDLSIVKEKFLRGEVAATSTTTTTTHSKRKKETYTNGNTMYNQIDVRLRKVLSRALQNSKDSENNAEKVICAFESLLTSLKADEQMKRKKDNAEEAEKGRKEREEVLKDVLLRLPSISWKEHSKKEKKHEEDEHISKKTLVAQFVFDAKGKGGFHRVLLHAVCQFHGLHAHSTTTSVTTEGGKDSKARMLTVTGKCHGRKFRLVDYAVPQPTLEEESGDKDATLSDSVLAGRMSTLQVSS
mmetsp:Transcript_22386/g.33479  ORF Transcript_22386/g.33479 Transcript_22386/m.33479 type:complete len:527 (+) Transcript_22386:162-1742(+)